MSKPRSHRIHEDEPAEACTVWGFGGGGSDRVITLLSEKQNLVGDIENVYNIKTYKIM